MITGIGLGQQRAERAVSPLTGKGAGTGDRSAVAQRLAVQAEAVELKNAGGIDLPDQLATQVECGAAVASA